MADEKEGAVEAPKKSKKMMLIIIVAAVVLLGGGGGAFVMMKSSSASPKTPSKGSVTAIEDALTINLADSHYLKLQFSIQQTSDAGSESVDTSEAIELAIDEYTGRTVAELSTDKGRAAIKEDLVAKIVKAYKEDKTEKVMDIYYTAFVTQ